MDFWVASYQRQTMHNAELPCHALKSCKGFAAIRDQLKKQQELFFEHCHFCAVICYRVGIIIKNSLADYKFAFRCHLGPAQQRLYTEDHFVDIDRLYHIVIGSGQKYLFQIHERIFGCYNQYGNLISGISKAGNQLVAIYARHHKVGNDQVGLGRVLNIQGIQAIVGFYDIVSV